MIIGKRQREDEYVAETSSCKKLRALPFRMSPLSTKNSFSATRNVPKPLTLTPVESDEESEIDFNSPAFRVPQIHGMVSPDTDIDMEVDEVARFESPLWSPKTSMTSKLAPAPMLSPMYPNLLSAPSPGISPNSRIPTPIYGHFSSALTLPNSRSPTLAPPAPGVVRTTDKKRDAFMRKRSLPSPISEGTQMESLNAATKDLFPDIDMGNEFNSVFPPTPEPSEAGSRRSSGDEPQVGGRRRSDAVSGEGSKVVFSMGYRADCEKCREKVPGHYSHVLRV